MIAYDFPMFKQPLSWNFVPEPPGVAVIRCLDQTWRPPSATVGRTVAGFCKDHCLLKSLNAFKQLCSFESFVELAPHLAETRHAV